MWKFSLVVLLATSVISEDENNRRSWTVRRAPSAEELLAFLPNRQENVTPSSQPNGINLQVPLLPNDGAPSVVPQVPNGPYSPLTPSDGAQNGLSAPAQSPVLQQNGPNMPYYPTNIFPNYGQYPVPNLPIQFNVPPQNTGPVQNVPPGGSNSYFGAVTNVNCKNTEVLLKVWTIFSNLLDTGGKPVQTPDADQIKFALILIKKYLQEAPQNAANVDIATKLMELETELLKNKGIILQDDRPLSSLLTYNPVLGPSVSFKYELPTNLRPACREAFLKTIETAQEAYRNLARSPICTGSGEVPQYPNNGFLYPGYPYNLPVDPNHNPYGSAPDSQNPQSPYIPPVPQIPPAKSDYALKTILDYLKNHDNHYPKEAEMILNSLPTSYPYFPTIDTTKVLPNPSSESHLNFDPPQNGVLTPNDLTLNQPQTPLSNPTGYNVGQPQSPFANLPVIVGHPQSPFVNLPGSKASQPQSSFANLLGFDVGQPQSPLTNSQGFNVGQPQSPFANSPDFNVGQPQSPFGFLPGFNLGQPQSPLNNTPDFEVGQPQSPFANVPSFNVGQTQTSYTNPTAGYSAPLPMNSPAFNFYYPQGKNVSPTQQSLFPLDGTDISSLITPNSPSQNDFPSYLKHVKNIADKLSALNPNQNVFHPGTDLTNLPVKFNTNPSYNTLDKNSNMLQNMPVGNGLNNAYTLQTNPTLVPVSSPDQNLNSMYPEESFIPDSNSLNPYGTNSPLNSYQNPYQMPFSNTLLTNPTNYQLFPDKVPTNALNTITNFGKSNQKTDGEIELTYVLKRPNPLVYQPFYFIKYRLPYNNFVKDFGKLISQNPLRASKADLYKNLIKMYNASEVSEDLAHLPKEQVKDMVLRSGALVNARLIPSNETEVNGLDVVEKKINKGNLTKQVTVGLPIISKVYPGDENVRVKRNFVTDTGLDDKPRVKFQPSIYQTGVLSEPLANLNVGLGRHLHKRPDFGAGPSSSILGHL